MASYNYTFQSGDGVTPTRLNDARTISDIVNADIKSDAAIALSKLATGALPSAITVASANLTYDNGPTGGFRNRIINGNFDIWQRGTSFTAQGYTADRWHLFITGTTCTLSRQAFTLGQTDVASEPTYFTRAVVTSSAGASNLCLFAQRIENVRMLAGQTATISFYAKADAARPVALELSQNFGTGGSPSATVTAIGSQKFNLTTSWQKFTATISVASISGKTIGTNGDSWLQLNFWLDAGSSFNLRTDTLGQQSGTFDIAQVQVEQGSKATPFEARPIGTELALCQRYYEVGGMGAVARAISATSAEGFGWQFKVTKRADPTIALRVNTPAVAEINVNARTGSGSAITVFASNKTGLGDAIISGFSGMTSPNMVVMIGDDLTASAEL